MKEHSSRPFSKDEERYIRSTCSFNYDSIPSNLRLGTSSREKIKLYKGAQRGLESVGFRSHAIEMGEKSKIEQAIRTIYRGEEEQIAALFNAHVSGDPLSALISTTFNPQQAQVFAPHRHHKDFSIYEIVVNANRCVYDPFDTGKCGNSGEIFVIGAIYPNEITAVKKDNSGDESELFYIDADGAGLIADKPNQYSVNRTIRNPKNWHRPISFRRLFE
jgi:hypothetical protein